MARGKKQTSSSKKKKKRAVAAARRRNSEGGTPAPPNVNETASNSEGGAPAPPNVNETNPYASLEEKASNLQALITLWEAESPWNLQQPLPGEDDKYLTCLGVPQILPEGFVNHVDPETEYGQIPRPANLPPGCLISLAAEDDDDLAAQGGEALNKLWNGEFQVTKMKLVGQGGQCRFEIRVDTEEPPQTMLVTYDKNTQAIEMNVHCVGPPLNNQLDQYQRRLLGGRVLHHFIRQCGWKLPPFLLEAMVNFLLVKFESKKLKKACLDLWIIRGDILLNIHDQECWQRETGLVPQECWQRETGLVMFKAGEVLEAMGLFPNAARLYAEVAQFLRNAEDEWNGYSAAGLAWKRALQWDAALECCLKALDRLAKISPGPLDLQDGNVNMQIGNLFKLETEKRLLSMKDETSTGLSIVGKEELVVLALAALLLSCRYDFDCDRDDQHQLMLYFGEQWVDELKPELTKPRNAEKQLQRIFSSGNVTTYKERILSSLSAGPGAFASKPNHDREDIVVNDNPQRLHKKAAHQFIKDQHTGTQLVNRCAACPQTETKTGGKLLWCSCKQISYCSKECQRMDWTRHRADSAWHKLHGTGNKKS